MNSILELTTVYKTNQDQLQRWLVENIEGFILSVPCDSIGFAQEPSDIARDYLDALLVGEVLWPYCKSIEASETQKGIETFILYSIIPSDIEGFAAKLWWVAEGFDYDDDEYMLAEFYELAEDFLTNILQGNQTTHFVELTHRFLEYADSLQEDEDEDIDEDD